MQCHAIFCCCFSESNERLQVHLKERMHSLEEKNHLSNELERCKKKVEEATESKARSDAELAALKLELTNIKLVLFARLVKNSVKLNVCFVFSTFRRIYKKKHKNCGSKSKTFEGNCFSKK